MAAWSCRSVTMPLSLRMRARIGKVRDLLAKSNILYAPKRGYHPGRRDPELRPPDTARQAAGGESSRSARDRCVMLRFLGSLKTRTAVATSLVIAAILLAHGFYLVLTKRGELRGDIE